MFSNEAINPFKALLVMILWLSLCVLVSKVLASIEASPMAIKPRESSTKIIPHPTFNTFKIEPKREVGGSGLSNELFVEKPIPKPIVEFTIN